MCKYFIFLLYGLSWNIFGQDTPQDLGELSASDDLEHCYRRINQSERHEGSLVLPGAEDENEQDTREQSQTR